MTLEEVVRRQRYRGRRKARSPEKVWREDNSARRKLLEGYKQMDDDADIVRVDGSTDVVKVLRWPTT